MPIVAVSDVHIQRWEHFTFASWRPRERVPGIHWAPRDLKLNPTSPRSLGQAGPGHTGVHCFTMGVSGYQTVLFRTACDLGTLLPRF